MINVVFVKTNKRNDIIDELQIQQLPLVGDRLHLPNSFEQWEVKSIIHYFNTNGNQSARIYLNGEAERVKND